MHGVCPGRASGLHRQWTVVISLLSPIRLLSPRARGWVSARATEPRGFSMPLLRFLSHCALTAGLMVILSSTVLAQTGPTVLPAGEAETRSPIPPGELTPSGHDPFIPPPDSFTPAEQPPRPPQPLDDPFASSMGGFGGGFGGFSAFGPGAGYGILASYRTTWIPDQAVVGQPTNLGEVRQDLSLRAPVHRGRLATLLAVSGESAAGADLRYPCDSAELDAAIPQRSVGCPRRSKL